MKSRLQPEEIEGMKRAAFLLQLDTHVQKKKNNMVTQKTHLQGWRRKYPSLATVVLLY